MIVLWGSTSAILRDFEKVFDSFKREVFYSILTDFSVPMKLVN
jgi:hypothetical protein